MCERIPFLILPVKQSSSEPSPRTVTPGQPAGMRQQSDMLNDAPSLPTHRSAASEVSGSTPGPSQSKRSAYMAYTLRNNERDGS